VYIPLKRDGCGRRSQTIRKAPELARTHSPCRRQMWTGGARPGSSRSGGSALSRARRTSPAPRSAR